MGSVYAARDLDWKTPHVVALKTAKLQGLEAERLLKDEAHIASQIEHQNVCRVHELGRDGDTSYLVLDYCDGASLHELLMAAPQGKLPPPLAVKIAASVAAGLHAAHEVRGLYGEPLDVIHRDVSPQNVLIASSGHVCLTDFGVAKAQGQSHRPTETGEVKGKASYMAPEQVKSHKIDRRADIFGLGCVLYQTLLGRKPYSGETTVSTLYQILETEIPPPTLIDPSFPQSLEPVLMKALEKNRDARYQTAEEFQFALEMWLVDQGTLITEHEIKTLLMSTIGPMIEERKANIIEFVQAAPQQLRAVPASSNMERDTTPPATAFRSESAVIRPQPTYLHRGIAVAVGLVISAAIFAISLDSSSVISPNNALTSAAQAQAPITTAAKDEALPPKPRLTTTHAANDHSNEESSASPTLPSSKTEEGATNDTPQQSDSQRSAKKTTGPAKAKHDNNRITPAQTEEAPPATSIKTPANHSSTKKRTLDTVNPFSKQ